MRGSPAHLREPRGRSRPRSRLRFRSRSVVPSSLGEDPPASLGVFSVRCGSLSHGGTADRSRKSTGERYHEVPERSLPQARERQARRFGDARFPRRRCGRGRCHRHAARPRGAHHARREAVALRSLAQLQARERGDASRERLPLRRRDLRAPARRDLRAPGRRQRSPGSGAHRQRRCCDRLAIAPLAGVPHGGPLLSSDRDPQGVPVSRKWEFPFGGTPISVFAREKQQTVFPLFLR